MAPHQHLVFFKCPSCGATTEELFTAGGDYKLVCYNCPTLMEWYRLRVYRENVTASGRSFNFIPPMHEYFEPGLPGGGKVVHSRKELENYARENGKIWASEKEISQEADHHRARLEKESDERLRINVRNSVGAYLAHTGQGRW
jgi:hypothetical protein